MANENRTKQGGSNPGESGGQSSQQQAEQRSQGQFGTAGQPGTDAGQSAKRGAESQGVPVGKGQQGGQGEQVRQGTQSTQGMGMQGAGSQASQGGGRSGGLQRRSEGAMANYARDPFSMIQNLSTEMDELFNAFLYGTPVSRRGRQRFSMPDLWSPQVDIREQDNQLRVRVDLPGVSKDSIKVDVHGGALTIEGERRDEQSDENGGFRRTECSYGSFFRSITLPEGADAEQAQAKMRDGVLEITLPVHQRQRGKRLDIQ